MSGIAWNMHLKKDWSWDLPHLQYVPPAKPTADEIATMLDPLERNVTFKDFNALAQRAQDWLAPTDAAKFELVPDERRRILDAAKAIRNCVAHQSTASFREMNERLLRLPDSGLAKSLRGRVSAVRNVGSYLKAVEGERTRVALYLDEFRALASALE